MKSFSLCVSPKNLSLKELFLREAEEIIEMRITNRKMLRCSHKGNMNGCSGWCLQTGLRGQEEEPGCGLSFHSTDRAGRSFPGF